MSEKDSQKPEEYTPKWWLHEVKQAEKELDEYWRTSADQIVSMYLADYTESGETENTVTGTSEKRYNIFWANTQIILSALYATPPKPRVSRQWGDAKDDIARTAALILERILQIGITKDQSDMHDSFRQATEDRLIPGLGQVWLRLDVETTKKKDENGQEYDALVHEEVVTDYVQWRDFIWPAARIWTEVPWVCRRVWLSKSAIKKRFGADKLKKLQDAISEAEAERPWLPKGFKKGRYEVFEIWCKETNHVYWVNIALDEEFLDDKDDPTQLEDFFPCPTPLISTHTSNNFIPRPEYAMAQDQYEELNVLNTRIYNLTAALRVVGVYDKTQSALELMFKQSDNRMVPVDNFSMLAEKGGLKGVIDWFPVEMVGMVLEKLVLQRQQVIQQIYELTSISDIMRGASNPRETLGAQKLKSQYSSVRLQLMQQAVGRFVRHAMRIKCELICKYMTPDTIKKMSGIMYTESAKFADQAIMLLKDYESSEYRIEVEEETLSIADYTAEREMRTEFLTAVGQFISQTQGTTQNMPQALPYMLRMVQWLASSFRGSADIETVMDEAIQMAQNMPPPQPEQQKPTGKSPMELQAEMQKTQMVEQNKAAIAREGNQTKVLIKEMEIGQAQDELAQAAIGMGLEHHSDQMARAADEQESAAQRAHDASQASEQREHDALQAESDRIHTESQSQADREFNQAESEANRQAAAKKEK